MNNKKTCTNQTSARTRNYATIVYPESAPDDWKNILADMHIPALISPLHDKDINPDGTLKKPHYHVLLLFDSVKTWRQAEEVFQQFGGVGTEPLKSCKAYARYLIHMDNPEKAQYDAANIVELGGANFSAVTYLPKDDVNVIRDMLDFIRTNQIDSFAQFSDICAATSDEWITALALRKNAYFFKEYIKSLFWEENQKLNGKEE